MDALIRDKFFTNNIQDIEERQLVDEIYEALHIINQVRQETSTGQGSK